MFNIIFSIFKDIQHQFSWSWHEKKSFFVTNSVKINIFWFSSITRLKLDPTQYVQYYFLHFPRNSTSVFLILTWTKSFFVTNRVKINIFWFSSITRLKSHPTRHIKYYFLHFWRYSTSVFFILTWKKIIFRHKSC